MYSGIRITPVVINLLIINTVILLIQEFAPFIIDTMYDLGLWYIDSSYFRPYQFFTYMFCHSGLPHFIPNMIALLVFGPSLENILGTNRFLVLYILSGIFSGLAHIGVIFSVIEQMNVAFDQYLTQMTPEAFVSFLNRFEPKLDYHQFIDFFSENPTNARASVASIDIIRDIIEHRKQNTVLAGASGSIFGLIMAYGVLFANWPMAVWLLPFPIKGKYIAIFSLALILIPMIADDGQSNVAHFAHLGGAISGFILGTIWNVRIHR